VCVEQNVIIQNRTIRFSRMSKHC